MINYKFRDEEIKMKYESAVEDGYVNRFLKFIANDYGNNEITINNIYDVYGNVLKGQTDIIGTTIDFSINNRDLSLYFYDFATYYRLEEKNITKYYTKYRNTFYLVRIDYHFDNDVLVSVSGDDSNSYHMSFKLNSSNTLYLNILKIVSLFDSFELTDINIVDLLNMLSSTINLEKYKIKIHDGNDSLISFNYGKLNDYRSLETKEDYTKKISIYSNNGNYVKIETFEKTIPVKNIGSELDEIGVRKRLTKTLSK